MTITTTRPWQLGFVTGFAIGLFLGLMLGLSNRAEAQTPPFEIPIETVHKGVPGELFHEGTIPVEPGAACIAELTFENDPGEEPSIHLGNDILVGPVTFTNVENGMFEAAALPFISDGVNEVMVRLGIDGVFSAGFTLEVTCNPPSTSTSTTSALTSTTTANPDTSSSTTIANPSSTTLSPPPVGGVDTGFGSCADGACDGFSLSPLATWLGIGVVWFLLAGLAWAFIAGTTRRSDG